MDDRILERLCPVTPEERAILDGKASIDRSLYMDGSHDVISGKKLLSPGKLMAVRPHTRFVRFPEHTHDYVEMVYMAQGTTTHIVNGTRIVLGTGELLMLGQNARQAILPAGEGDIAVNFIIRPAFFGGTLPYMDGENSPLRDFLIRCLGGENPSGYLLFRVADVKPVQNLIENLLWTLVLDAPNKRSINQLTMGLLFTELINCADRLSTGERVQETTVSVLRYIEENYAAGSLAEIAGILHYDAAWLSREIKRRTGRTYTQLVQEKRLSQAAWLLRNTDKNVDDIALSVGYENISYFHRLFAAHFQASPKKYRDSLRKPG